LGEDNAWRARAPIMMDTLQTLRSLGLELPGPAYLFGAIVFGLIGLAAWRHGRKTGRRRTLWLGVALMLYPYAVTQTWVLYAVGIALSVAVLIDRR
jgi:hypothetical protein